MFFTNAFSFSSRNALCDHAYRVTRLDLLERADELEGMLSKMGITINRKILADQDRSLEDSLNEGYYGRSDVSRKLSVALGELQHQIKNHAS